jgi:hypothetical protein
MNSSSTKSLGILACSILVALTPMAAFGQAAKVVGDKPSFDDLPSPEFNGGKNKAFKPKDWLEIEAKLKVSLTPEPKSKTCDKITVKWYVAVKNPDKVGTMLLLTKTIEHVNVPLDQDIYCSVYLSPASIKRITGFDKGAKSTVEYVGYEVLINGEKMVADTNKGSSGEGGVQAWWNSTSDKISRSEAVPLLNKTETPFSIMWWDRYAEVSTERR